MKIYLQISPLCDKNVSYKKHILQHIHVTMELLRKRLHYNPEMFFEDNGNEEKMFDDIFPEFYQDYWYTPKLYGIYDHYNLAVTPIRLLYAWEHEDLRNLFNKIPVPEGLPSSFDKDVFNGVVSNDKVKVSEPFCFDDLDILIDIYNRSDKERKEFTYIGKYDTTNVGDYALKLDGEPLH